MRGPGVTIFTEPKTSGDERGAEIKTTELRCKIVMDRFSCVKIPERFGSGEIHWCVASGSHTDGTNTIQTRDYSSVQTGNTQKFDRNTAVFDGRIVHHVAGQITFWEAGDSDDDWNISLERFLQDFSCQYVFGAISQRVDDKWMIEVQGNTQDAYLIAVLGLTSSLFGTLLSWARNDVDLFASHST